MIELKLNKKIKIKFRFFPKIKKLFRSIAFIKI